MATTPPRQRTTSSDDVPATPSIFTVMSNPEAYGGQGRRGITNDLFFSLANEGAVLSSAFVRVSAERDRLKQKINQMQSDLADQDKLVSKLQDQVTELQEKIRHTADTLALDAMKSQLKQAEALLVAAVADKDKLVISTGSPTARRLHA